jgi:hypothetical protein
VQGHSIEVDLKYEPTAPPETLYHGTATGSSTPSNNRVCTRALDNTSICQQCVTPHEPLGHVMVIL